MSPTGAKADSYLLSQCKIEVGGLYIKKYYIVYIKIVKHG